MYELIKRHGVHWPGVPSPEPKFVEVKPSKQEMREYYKSIRSKPKNKKPQHITREYFDM